MEGKLILHRIRSFRIRKLEARAKEISSSKMMDLIQVVIRSKLEFKAQSFHLDQGSTQVFEIKTIYILKK